MTLLTLGEYIAVLAAVLGLWWLKCEIQDRIHARQTVARWDAFVARQDQWLAFREEARHRTDDQ